MNEDEKREIAQKIVDHFSDDIITLDILLQWARTPSPISATSEPNPDPYIMQNTGIRYGMEKMLIKDKIEKIINKIEESGLEWYGLGYHSLISSDGEGIRYIVEIIKKQYKNLFLKNRLEKLESLNSEEKRLVWLYKKYKSVFPSTYDSRRFNLNQEEDNVCAYFYAIFNRRYNGKIFEPLIKAGIVDILEWCTSNKGRDVYDEVVESLFPDEILAQLQDDTISIEIPNVEEYMGTLLQNNNYSQLRLIDDVYNNQIKYYKKDDLNVLSLRTRKFLIGKLLPEPHIINIYKDYVAINPFLLEKIGNILDDFKSNLIGEIETKIEESFQGIMNDNRDKFGYFPIDESIWTVQYEGMKDLFVSYYPWINPDDINSIWSIMNKYNTFNILLISNADTISSIKRMIDRFSDGFNSGKLSFTILAKEGNAEGEYHLRTYGKEHKLIKTILNEFIKNGWEIEGFDAKPVELEQKPETESEAYEKNDEDGEPEAEEESITDVIPKPTPQIPIAVSSDSDDDTIIGFELATGRPVNVGEYHCLFAGSTGSGKTVALKRYINCWLNNNEGAKVIIFDSKPPDSEEQIRDFEDFGMQLYPQMPTPKDDFPLLFKSFVKSQWQVNLDNTQNNYIDSIGRYCERHDISEWKKFSEIIETDDLLDDDKINFRKLEKYQDIKKYLISDQDFYGRIGFLKFIEKFTPGDDVVASLNTKNRIFTVNLTELPDFIKPAIALSIIRKVKMLHPSDIAFAIDEAWSFIPQQHANEIQKLLRQFIEEDIRVARNNNRSYIFSSQTWIGLSVDIRRNCVNQFVGQLPDENDTARARRKFGLKEDAFSVIGKGNFVGFIRPSNDTPIREEEDENTEYTGKMAIRFVKDTAVAKDSKIYNPEEVRRISKNIKSPFR